MPKSRFYQQLFESINLQVALDQQAFEPAIRALTLFKASGLIDRHAAIDAPPAIERGLAAAILGQMELTVKTISPSVTLPIG